MRSDQLFSFSFRLHHRQTTTRAAARKELIRGQSNQMLAKSVLRNVLLLVRDVPRSVGFFERGLGLKGLFLLPSVLSCSGPPLVSRLTPPDSAVQRTNKRRDLDGIGREHRPQRGHLVSEITRSTIRAGDSTDDVQRVVS